MSLHILVTGGAGYIGAHCCKAFGARGWTVTVFDDLSRGWRDFVRWGDVIEGDICDRDAVAEAVRRTQPDLVAHFAALADVAESVADPAAYYETNVLGALNLLDAMRAERVDRLVFSSTCATYGEPQQSPMRESHPQAPVNPYGWSKLMVERLLADYGASYGLRSVALRYFNAAGADPEAEIGERHDPETHLIPRAIMGALDGSFEFSIFGDDYDTRDGTAVRDYVHVADLADAHCRAIDRLASETGQSSAAEAFNLGTGHGATVLEIVAAVEQAAGRALPRKIGPRRAGDPAQLVASAEKAAEVLGWRPERSSIEQIIQDAWAWHVKEAG